MHNHHHQSKQPSRTELAAFCRAGLILIAALFILGSGPVGAATETPYPITFTDAGQRLIVLKEKPQRVVSLVPAITEIILRIGAGKELAGITYHSVLPPECAEKTIVGGYSAPDIERIRKLHPDLIFYAGIQQEIPAAFKESGITLVEVAPDSIEKTFFLISRLGRIFGHRQEAIKVIAEEQRQLDVIADKIARIPADQRKRVMRIMGRGRLMAPGDDSFQNQYIRRAGGIAPRFGRNGSIIEVSLAEWQKFNPQVIYGCGSDRELLKLLNKPGWNEVEAVRNHRIFFFPCDFTCRSATHCGTFVSWLAARIYEKEFENPANFVRPERVVGSRPVKLGFDYLERADIVTSEIKDFRNQTLVLTLKEPMRVLSTLEGEKSGVKFVANHYFPAPAWGLDHLSGLRGLRRATLKTLGLKPDETAILFTGARMDCLSISRQSFRELEVTALVTAGIVSNALRMSADRGSFYEPGVRKKLHKPGTINILLLTNNQLTRRAMARAVITATEAKTAALEDLDIRSCATPAVNQATGTGTDNLIVVEGRGACTIDNAGGHSKFGELIAKAVYNGVREAIRKQNGLVAQRSIFQRLRERRLDLSLLCREAAGGDRKKTRKLRTRVEELLLEARYAGFLEAQMSLSDARERGLVKNLDAAKAWCDQTAAEIAGRPVDLKPFIPADVPPVLGRGIAAILAGAAAGI